MRRYETMMVLHPELPEAQTRETIDRARKLVEGMGADVHEIDEWGMRDLAYEIRKLNRGYYVVAEYSADPAVVTELERNLKLSDEILRYMTVARSVTRRRSSAVPAPRSRDEAVAEESAQPAGAVAEQTSPAPASDPDTPAPVAEPQGDDAGQAVEEQPAAATEETSSESEDKNA